MMLLSAADNLHILQSLSGEGEISVVSCHHSGAHPESPRHSGILLACGRRKRELGQKPKWPLGLQPEMAHITFRISLAKAI